MRVQSKQDGTATTHKHQQYITKKGNSVGAQLEKPPLLRIYLSQLLVLIAVSISLLMVDLTTAISALCGGLISIGPSAYFARYAFRFSGAQSAASVTQSFYRGEAGKFVLTTVSFVCVFVLLRPVNIVALFLSYIGVLVLNWVLVLRCIDR